MLINLHSQATTTPKVRAEIQASDEPVWVLAERYGVANLRDLKGKAARPKHSDFDAYEPGYIHIDVKYLPLPLGTFPSEIPCRAVNG